MPKPKFLVLALLGGLLMGLASAPTQAWFFAWVALVPLWYVLLQNHRFSVWLPMAWGFGYHGLALFWITGVHPMTWMGVPWLASLGIAIFCWLFITFWGTGLVVAWGAGVFYLSAKFDKWPKMLNVLASVLVGVGLWCGLENVWSNTPLWWSSLAYTQSPGNLPILQFGQFSGPSTITGAIVAVNGLLAVSLHNLALLPFDESPHPLLRSQKSEVRSQKSEVFFNTTQSDPSPLSFSSPHRGEGGKRRRGENWRLLWLNFGLALGLFVGMYVSGGFLLNRPLETPSDLAIKVGIIQGNVPNTIKLYPEGWRKAIEGYTQGYLDLAEQGVEVVLTPETALPFVWDEFKASNSSFYQGILQEGIPAWVGGFGKEGSRFTNSLFTITGDGNTFSRYNKVKLVPLGEYIPFEEILGKLISRLSPLDAQLARGKSGQVFETPFGRAIVGICYESAFSEHFRRQASEGGEFIITSSNNAHYSKTMPAQHHALDVMRAIESDRWAARATNTGYSAIVDPRGRTLWISDIDTYEIHADLIYKRQTKTLYVRWGDWLTVLLLVLGAMAIGYGYISCLREIQ